MSIFLMGMSLPRYGCNLCNTLRHVRSDGLEQAVLLLHLFHYLFLIHFLLYLDHLILNILLHYFHLPSIFFSEIFIFYHLL